jgi:hypothetical protein
VRKRNERDDDGRSRSEREEIPGEKNETPSEKTLN